MPAFDQQGVILATMTVPDSWLPNKAAKVFGADDDAYLAVHYLHNSAGGPVTGLKQTDGAS